MTVLDSSLLGAAIGFGVGGSAQSAAGGAAIGYALNKLTNHKPLFGGKKCPKGKILNPESGRCVKLNGRIGKKLSPRRTM
jgi:hypothetical protein